YSIQLFLLQFRSLSPSSVTSRRPEISTMQNSHTRTFLYLISRSHSQSLNTHQRQRQFC
ncbi:hypothetical protein L9F63_003512, partial [Diploptera punctata]